MAKPPGNPIPKTTTAPSAKAEASGQPTAARGPAAAIMGMEDTAPFLHALLNEALQLKAQASRGPLPPLLQGKAVLMIYEKNSTRTRVSFEVGIQRLGGIAINLDAQTSQLSRGESMEDTAQVLSRYGHALVFRAKQHSSLEELARFATVPVINALTDREHPCQILADWMTLAEHFGGVDQLRGKTFCYVGDGNNMAHSYLLGAPLVGMDIRIATPKGYKPEAAIVARARELAQQNGTKVTLTSDPREAIRGSHAVATDTWVSMGDEAEETQRTKAFQGYTLDEGMMTHAEPGAVFLHCLPGHWGQEATHELAHGPRSLIYDEAENRMWAQMALVARLVNAAN
jgi:ornithine carbamoyltransferase